MERLLQNGRDSDLSVLKDIPAPERERGDRHKPNLEFRPDRMEEKSAHCAAEA